LTTEEITNFKLLQQKCGAFINKRKAEKRTQKLMFVAHDHCIAQHEYFKHLFNRILIS
jgi:hypothetical protein